MLAGVSPPASAATGTPFSQAQFSAVGSGSEAFVRALTAGTTTLADVEQAVAAQSVNSTGLSGNTHGQSALFDSDTHGLIQPKGFGSKNAYAGGSGIEAGLGIDNTAPTNQNQLVFPSGATSSTRVEVGSPPSPSTASKSLADLSSTPLAPVVKAKALEATAGTNFNSNFCPLGNPIAYGEGHLADAGVLNQSDTPTVDVTTNSRGVAQSKTFSYLFPNSDNTFGIVSQTQQTIVPATINLGPLKIGITVQGGAGPVPIDLKARAPGEAGQNGGVTLSNDGTVSIDIKNGGTELSGFPINIPLLQSLPAALKNINIPGVASIKIDDLEPMTGSNGTTMAGATFDLVRVKLANSQLADLAVGHMVSIAQANTPIECNIPTTKTANPNVVQAGNQFTWNISIPTSADDLKDSACSLGNLSATDHFDVLSGNPSFEFVSASNGGAFDSKTNTVTWSNLGTYKVGDPPIHLTITMNVPSGSLDGVLENTVTPHATLICPPPGAPGNLLPSEVQATLLAALSKVPVSGLAHVSGPQIMAVKQLPRTGGGGPILPWVGGGLLVLAEATRRLIRRARRAPATS
jgi:hypothetical protein